MRLDRGQLIDAVVRSVEERLAPGASGVIADVSAFVPDRPGMPDVPGMPEPAGFIPQTPGMPSTPSMPQAPSVPQMPDVPRMPQAPEVPSVPGKDQLDDFDRIRHTGDQIHHTNGAVHGVGRHAAYEQAERREIEADGFADFFEEDKEPQRERVPLTDDEERATAVLRVCRNGWNTIDTRAVGGHWFSA
jgi:hypothetical protein